MKVFISYRRRGDRGTVGRLADRLTIRYGSESVFRDADVLRPGQDFSGVILERLEAAEVVLAVIDRSWVGRRWVWWSRMRDPNDWVRRELEHALQKSTPILPVLLEDTPVPQPRSLPSSLHGLLSVQVARLRDESWEADLQVLFKALEDSTRGAPSVLTWPALDLVELRNRQGRDRLATVLITAGISVAAAALAVFFWLKSQPIPRALPPAEVELNRPETWTLPPADSSTSRVAHAALRAALVELQSSTREANGTNDGFNVQKFTARFTTPGGAGSLPWSAAFATWCYLDAVKRLSNDGNAKLPFSDSASAAEIHKSLSRQGWVKQPFDLNSARPGDMVFFTAQNRIAHVELVYAVKDGRVCSIGGNVRNQVSGACREVGGESFAISALGSVPAQAIDPPVAKPTGK